MYHGKNITPGMVFKEFVFLGDWKIVDCPYDKWQRVTDPSAANPGAATYLPNPVNIIFIDDLDDAVAAEIGIEVWGGHAGTSKKQFRINNSDWIDIPESEYMGPPPAEQYQCFRYPQIKIDCSLLHEGENTFELNSGPQVSHDFGWGQWGIYGVTFRVYFNPEKAQFSGKLETPVVENNEIKLTFTPESTESSIDNVSFIAFWEDFDHQGDGSYTDWHFRYRYGEMFDHLNTVTSYPFTCIKDLSWIPEQKGTVKFVAIVKDYKGICKVSNIVEIETLPSTGCKMIKPQNVPGSWQTRDKNYQSCFWDLDFDINTIASTKVVFSTWNGYECDAISVNENILIKRIGRDHDYSLNELDVPNEFLVQGKNYFTTYSETESHGIEVLWPGPVLKVRFKNKNV